MNERKKKTASLPVRGSEGDVKIVKVKAFPIACRIKKNDGEPGFKVEIIHLEEKGFIFVSVGHFFRVSQNYICDFDLPILHDNIHQSVKIIKTTQSTAQYIPTGSKDKVMTVEVHFKSHSEDLKRIISKFLAKIKRRE